MSNKDNASQGNRSKECKPFKSKSILVGLSLLFILIIVVGLFEKFVGSNLFKIELLYIISLFNIPSFVIKFTEVDLNSILLHILPFCIAILSGCIVYQKDKEKRDKQQDMNGEIEKFEKVLDDIYGKGK